MTDEQAELEALNSYIDDESIDFGPTDETEAFRAGFRSALAHARSQQAERNVTHVFITPEQVGNYFRSALFALRASGHTSEDERTGMHSHSTDALRAEALDYAGFCWLHPGEMAPGCGCPWSKSDPGASRKHAESRLTKLIQQAERLRAAEAVVEAARKYHATWNSYKHEQEQPWLELRHALKAYDRAKAAGGEKDSGSNSLQIRCTCVGSKLVTPPGWHEPQCPFAQPEQKAVPIPDCLPDQQAETALSAWEAYWRKGWHAEPNEQVKGAYLWGYRAGSLLEKGGER